MVEKKALCRARVSALLIKGNSQQNNRLHCLSGAACVNLDHTPIERFSALVLL
jgi:hypothetical protein